MAGALAEESPRAGGINQESGAETDGRLIPPPRQLPAIARDSDSLRQLNLIDVLRSAVHRLLEQEVIEIGPVPMGIRYSIAGTGSYEQFIGVVFQRMKRPSFYMVIEGKSPLQPTANLGICFLPVSPAGQRLQSREVITDGELFQ